MKIVIILKIHNKYLENYFITKTKETLRNIVLCPKLEARIHGYYKTGER